MGLLNLVCRFGLKWGFSLVTGRAKDGWERPGNGIYSVVPKGSFGGYCGGARGRWFLWPLWRCLWAFLASRLKNGMPISLKKNPSNKGRLEKKDRNPPGPECVAVVLVEGTLLGPVIIKGQIIILIQVTFPIIHFRTLPTLYNLYTLYSTLFMGYLTRQDLAIGN